MCRCNQLIDRPTAVGWEDRRKQFVHYYIAPSKPNPTPPPRAFLHLELNTKPLIHFFSSLFASQTMGTFSMTDQPLRSIKFPKTQLDLHFNQLRREEACISGRILASPSERLLSRFRYSFLDMPGRQGGLAFILVDKVAAEIRHPQRKARG